MNPDDFLSLAGKLVAESSPSEAACRTAIGRAYYAAFHLARKYLTEIGFEVGRDHALPQRYLMGCGEPSALRVGQELNQLQSERVKADYDLTAPIDLTRARRCVEATHDFHTRLWECGELSLREVIKTGIESYRQKLKSL